MNRTFCPSNSLSPQSVLNSYNYLSSKGLGKERGHINTDNTFYVLERRYKVSNT